MQKTVCNCSGLFRDEKSTMVLHLLDQVLWYTGTIYTVHVLWSVWGPCYVNVIMIPSGWIIANAEHITNKKETQHTWYRNKQFLHNKVLYSPKKCQKGTKGKKMKLHFKRFCSFHNCGSWESCRVCESFTIYLHKNQVHDSPISQASSKPWHERISRKAWIHCKSSGENERERQWPDEVS